MRALALVLLAACHPSTRCEGTSILTGEIAADDLDASRTAWADLKASLGASYCYDRSTSYFSGERIEAAIRVSNDRVVSRTVDSTRTGFVHEEAEGVSTSDALPGVTIDQLYDLCETEVLVQDRSANDVTLMLADNGALRRCYFVPKSCQDDCTVGATIDHLTDSIE